MLSQESLQQIDREIAKYPPDQTQSAVGRRGPLRRQSWWSRVTLLVRDMIFDRKRVRERILRRVLGDDYLLFKIGRFRRSGEIHWRLYDRCSLARVMKKAGFSEIVVRRAGESAVEGWSGFGLELDRQGRELKPDSIYVEAKKKG